MSFILNDTGLKITSATNKVLFDSARSTPHITDIVSGTLYSGEQTGAVGTMNYFTLDGTPIETELYCQLVGQYYEEYAGPIITIANTFIMPYYKVSLPVSNSKQGAYPVGDTGGNWIAANGGMLLRAYSSTKEYEYTGAVQGTQYVHAYIPSNGILRVEVVTNISGHYSTSDAIAPTPRVQQYQGNTTRVIPHTAFTVDYKIFIGTT